MIKVDKQREPDFFRDFKRKNKQKINNWDDMNDYFEIKKELRLYMLIEEQNLFCPYCEGMINTEEEGSIEHIKPKDRFKDLILEYNNLITSCKSNFSCDNFKGGSWDDKFINPVIDNPKEYFSYDLYTGEIIPKEESGIIYERAKQTIEMLNLNHNKIKRARKTFIIQIAQAKPEELCYYNQYPSLLNYYRENC